MSGSETTPEATTAPVSEAETEAETEEETPELKKYPDIDEERLPHQQKGVFMLRVEEYLRPIDPSHYYRTSGEAVEKMESLIRDLHEQLVAAKKLHSQLVSLRGRNKYLETEADKSGTILKIKNPRSAKAKPRKIRTDIPSFHDIAGYGDKIFSKPAKKDGVTSYCVINPDKEVYVYFNCYNNEVNKKTLKFKPLDQDVKIFESTLRSKGYKKVLL